MGKECAIQKLQVKTLWLQFKINDLLYIVPGLNLEIKLKI